MIRFVIVLMGVGLLWVGGCAGTRVWDGPSVEPLRDGGGVVESGMYRDMPYVMASVNGSEPMKFLFDTGASLNVLFTSDAADLNIQPIGNMQVKGASGLIKMLPVSIVDEVEFGPISMTDMAFLIHDLGEHFFLLGPNIQHMDHGVAGIIGIRGLEEFTIDINFPNQQVAITDERLSLEDPGTSVMYTRSDGLFMVPVRFADPDEPESSRIIWSLLDTGNVGMFNIHSDDAGLLLDQSKVTGGHGSMGIHRIEQLVDVGPMRMGMRIGDTELEGMNASVSDVSSRLDSSSLRNFHLKIDMKSKLVSFIRSDGATRLVSTERMGITSLWTLDGYRIDQTLKGSAAYLMGIRAFDEVMLIDGVEPSELHVKTKYWATDPQATTITVRIRRRSDDGWVDVELPINGAVEGITERDQINEENPSVEIEMTGLDGEVTRVIMEPVEPADEHKKAAP